MANAIVIGKGPAGISAAIYLVRAGFEVVVIGKDLGALTKADKVENYYGFISPVSGPEIVEEGIAQAERLGVKVITDEVVGIGFESKLSVSTKTKKYDGDVVIIATGTSRSTPNIGGFKKFEGKGVSYCAVCDAFFYKGKNVGVLGNGDYAVHEAIELLPTSASVTIFTNGKPMEAKVPDGINVVESEIKEIYGDDLIGGITLSDGNSISVDGLFVALGVAGSTALARKIGAPIDGNKIVVDENQSTGIPGLYAAGDCTGGLLQIAKAVSDGAKAGTAAIKYLRTLKN